MKSSHVDHASASLVGVGMDAGLVEEILAVTDRLRADVGPEADGHQLSSEVACAHFQS